MSTYHYFYFVKDVNGNMYGSNVNPVTNDFYPPVSGFCSNCKKSYFYLYTLINEMDEDPKTKNLRCSIKGSNCLRR